MFSFSEKTKRNLFFISSTTIIVFAILLRLTVFNLRGGDHLQYKQAVLEFEQGINPYIYTVQSFTINTLKHGYAYFPTLLYILFAVWKFNVITQLNIPTAILFKIPVLLADMTIAYFLLNFFYKKKSYLAGLISVFIWIISPYFISNYEYTLFDPIQIIFLYLAALYVNKKSFKSSIFFALACSIKIIPIVLLPTFLLKTPKKFKYLIGMGLVFFIISIPFLNSSLDFYYYIRATLLVHGSRGIQGRPFFTFLTYYLQNHNISFYQAEYSTIYSIIAITIATTIPLLFVYKKKISNSFDLTTLALGIYLIFTPVLSRTHLLWILPFLLITLYRFFSSKKAYCYYLTLIACTYQ